MAGVSMHACLVYYISAAELFLTLPFVTLIYAFVPSTFCFMTFCFALFIQETSDHLLYPNPGSGMLHEQHLQFFHFLGTLLAKV
jgi:hypothetical protein